MMRLIGAAILAWLGFAGPAMAQQKVESAGATRVAEAEIDLVPPPDALSLGHHGAVVLEGEVLADDHIGNAAVVGSSRSELLNADALARSTKFQLGPDITANHPQKIRLTINYGAFDLDHLGVGYLCAQAVRDHDWYVSAFPEKPIEASRFKTFVKSMGLFDNRMAFARDPDRLEAAWRDTISRCHGRPSASVLGLMALIGNGKTVPE